MEQIVFENKLRTQYRQAVTSELINSVVFGTVSRGDSEEGEPPAIISFYTADESAALWDKRRKRIKYGLTVIDTKFDKEHSIELPVWVNLYTPEAVFEIKKDDNGVWTSRENKHKMKRPLIEPLAYCPTLKRPFGKSRITRGVMSIQDSAVRCALRTEVAAEFATAPQKYILGADDTIFEETSKWQAYIGTIMAISKDEDGDVPHFGQLSPGSLENHISYLRSLASRFSGETNVPISELGVVSDNPSSAEAIYAAKEALISDAEALNETNGESLKVLGKLALACAANKSLDELSEDERSIQARFLNPARPSLVSQADAMTKAASVASWIAETEVFLEELGYDEPTRNLMLSQKEEIEAKALIANAMMNNQIPAGE